jgi:hypothetical protein
VDRPNDLGIGSNLVLFTILMFIINYEFYKLTSLMFFLPRYLTGNLFTGPLPNWIARPDYTCVILPTLLILFIDLKIITSAC